MDPETLRSMLNVSFGVECTGMCGVYLPHEYLQLLFLSANFTEDQLDQLPTLLQLEYLESGFGFPRFWHRWILDDKPASRFLGKNCRRDRSIPGRSRLLR